jgi:hypothetical protein
MTLQKQLEYIHREFLVDTQSVEDLNDPKASIAEVDYDSGPRKEIKKERTNRTSTIFFAIVTVTALFAVAFIMTPQHASAAVHHKAHTASKDKMSLHQVEVIPEMHGKILNATGLKGLLKGPYGNSIIIGGMMSGGY